MSNRKAKPKTPRQLRRELERKTDRERQKADRAARRRGVEFAEAAKVQAEGRTCEDCTACCRVPATNLGSVPEFAEAYPQGKPRGTPCPMLLPSAMAPAASEALADLEAAGIVEVTREPLDRPVAGCSIYDRRPDLCRGYLCAYREGLLAARPSECGLLFYRDETDKGVSYLLVEELEPGAAETEAGRAAWLDAAESMTHVRDGFLVLVTHREGYGAMRLPGADLENMKPAGMPGPVPGWRFLAKAANRYAVAERFLPEAHVADGEPWTVQLVDEDDPEGPVVCRDAEGRDRWAMPQSVYRDLQERRTEEGKRADDPADLPEITRELEAAQDAQEESGAERARGLLGAFAAGAASWFGYGRASMPPPMERPSGPGKKRRRGRQW